MEKLLNRGVGLLGLFTVLAIAGCSKGPKLYNVEGIVNVDGTPTEGIDLLFFKKGQTVASASGSSAAGGVLSTVTSGELGIELGDYDVVAIYPDPKFDKQPPPGMGKPPIQRPDLFGGKYFKKKVSMKIASGEKVTIDLTLK